MKLFSYVLFVLITYYIISRIKQVNLGYRDDDVYIPVLFYADDGLILTKNRRNLAELTKIVEESGLECGLKINKEKCNIMIFNDNKCDNIEGIKVVPSLKYLGITIENKRRWTAEQIEIGHEKGTKLCNYMTSVIGGSCNRLLIGKTFWKNVALPGILYGQEVMIYRSADQQ